MLAFLADKARGGQVAVLAAEVVDQLTSVPHDKLLPPHTVSDLLKLDLLLRGKSAATLLPRFSSILSAFYEIWTISDPLSLNSGN